MVQGVAAMSASASASIKGFTGTDQVGLFSSSLYIFDLIGLNGFDWASAGFSGSNHVH